MAEILTPRFCLRLLAVEEAPIITRFRVENKSHLEPWEPRRQPEFFTEAFWRLQIRALAKDYVMGNSVCFTILAAEDRSQVLGVCNYTNIVRGTFQSCHLGYALAEQAQGKGVMLEALSGSIEYMFKVKKLHRIMANYLPQNHRSAKLLTKLGFEIEGRAKDYLMINGRWQDHILTSLINPSHSNAGKDE
ncbi:MAG: ribosomal protein S5-alanine N-acetyltransferase [Pseudomonadales bacterium]|nr:ribosomal protein S5-alanine N-acetyltransferase [Pseudomonadales bacterium]